MQTGGGLAGPRVGLTPAEGLTPSPHKRAPVVGCAGRLGSLEIGKQADIAIMNVTDYRDLASNFGANLVYATLKRGAVIYREAEVLTPGSNTRQSGEHPMLH